MRSCGDFHKDLFGRSKRAHQIYDAKLLYNSIGDQVFSLPDDYAFYPTHFPSDMQTHMIAGEEKVSRSPQRIGIRKLTRESN